MRTIEIQTVMDPEALYKFQQENWDAFHNALGYLTLYGLQTYNHVSVMIARDCEMTAFYQQKADDGTQLRKFVMGGIWHPEDKRYSFHS